MKKEENKEIVTPLRFVTVFLIILILIGSWFLWAKLEEEKNTNKELEKQINDLNNNIKDKNTEIQNLNTKYENEKKDSRKYYNLYSDVKKDLKECKEQEPIVKTVKEIHGCYSEVCNYDNYISKNDYEELLQEYKNLVFKQNIEEGINAFAEGYSCASVLEGNIFAIENCLNILEKIN